MCTRGPTHGSRPLPICGRLPSRSCAAAIEVVTCAPATVGAPRARALHAQQGSLMSESTGKSRIGVTGLAVMGANLARNIARRGTPTAVHNRTTAKTTEFMKEYGHEGPFTGCETTEDFVAATHGRSS
jgi:hypothetical protein